MWATPHKALTNSFAQAGGNRTSEAPGVVFDPTIGDEVVETPLPNASVHLEETSKQTNVPPMC